MIKLQCVCKHVLKLPDKLAGAKVRCKHCEKILKVPQTPSPTGKYERVDTNAELLVVGSRPCPGCGQPYPRTVVVCVTCGLNVDTGAQLYVSLDQTPQPRFGPDGALLASTEEEAKPGFFARLLRKLGMGSKTSE